MRRIAVRCLLLLSLVHCKEQRSQPGQTVHARPSAEPLTRTPIASQAVPGPPSSSERATQSSAPNRLIPLRAEQLIQTAVARRSKGTLINAWASWCGPCRAELPMLQALADNLAPREIAVLLVSVDEPEDRNKAEAFLKSFEIRLPAYMAARPLDTFINGLNPRWPGMIPATFLLDATGKLRYFWGGPVEEHELASIVDGFLAGKAIDGESDFTLAPGQVEH